MWWMRISVVPAHGPPTRPPFARNSSIILALKSPAAAVSATVSSRASGVLVMAANPGLERVALIASPRRPVQDRVVAHQELDPAARGRVGLVDGAALERKAAHCR